MSGRYPPAILRAAATALAQKHPDRTAAELSEDVFCVLDATVPLLTTPPLCQCPHPHQEEAVMCYVCGLPLPGRVDAWLAARARLGLDGGPPGGCDG